MCKGPRRSEELLSRIPSEDDRKSAAGK